MKTKTLILTAALSVAGLASSHAQVFSSNAVGYVNMTVPASTFTAITNPLDAVPNADDTLGDLFPAGTVPDGTVIFKWNGAGYTSNAYDFGAWVDPNMTLNPGEGLFIACPAETTITFVGEVMQGTLSTQYASGYTMLGSQVPQAGLVTDDLGLAVADGTQILQWNGTGYVSSNFDFGAWDSQPTIGVGEAFFIGAPAAGSWDRDFSIN
jgi:hypothetical protein